MNAADGYKITAIFFVALAFYVIGLMVGAWDTLSDNDKGLSLFGVGLMFVMAFMFYGFTQPNRWPLRERKVVA